ncbi:AI-2E family transporter [uncultured Ilyobacter sp.]|uniref:AI-2E family transporter n=1 Tax=uncultured Ilyobacter sp. TaxID=544433 RepID=UPI0029C94776|nr:AI-2E family transporter [uncultured Ilyobacter sp.]
MRDNRFYIKFFLIGLFLVVIQSLLQDLESLKLVVNGFYKYIQPFIYGLVLAVILEPLINFFSNKFHIRRDLGIFFSILIVTIVFIGLFFVVIPPLSKSMGELMESFPSMKNKSQAWIIKMFEANKNRLYFLDEKVLKDKLMNFIGSQVVKTQSLVVTFLEKVIKLTFSIVDIFFGFLIAIYFLLYKEYFIKFIRKTLSIFLKKKTVNESLEFIFQSRKVFIDYLSGRSLVSLCVGVVCLLIMFFTNVPYAFLISFIIGLGNMIPYIGSIIAGIISTVLVLFTIPLKVIPMWIAILVAQQIDSWILGPKILGNSVGMNPFWVVTAVLIGGNVGGPVGMLIGVPIFAMIKIIYYKILDSKGISETEEG